MTNPFLTKYDDITKLIHAGRLADHKEHFPAIVEEMGLNDALKAIREQEDMCILVPIAIHRALSFYEAINSSTVEPLANEMRVGFMSAILSAGVHYHFYVDNDNHLTTMPSYLSRWQKLEFLKPFFKSEDHAHLKKLTSLMTSVRPTENSCRKVAMGVQLRDAICMWPSSKDSAVIDFMTGRSYRSDLLPEWARDTVAAQTMQTFDEYKAASMLRHPYTTTFFSTWARAKAFEENIASKLKMLEQKLQKDYEMPCKGC